MRGCEHDVAGGSRRGDGGESESESSVSVGDRMRELVIGGFGFRRGAWIDSDRGMSVLGRNGTNGAEISDSSSIPEFEDPPGSMGGMEASSVTCPCSGEPTHSSEKVGNIQSWITLGDSLGSSAGKTSSQ